MIYIIMCTYNGEKYLQEQLESIAENTVTEWQLWISDDGSCDQTKQIVEKFQKRYPDKVTFMIHDKNNGIALHFLERIKYCFEHMQDDDFLMLCDQDDVWYPDKIEVTLEHMQKLRSEYGNNLPLAVCSDVEVVNENKEQIAASFRKMNHYEISKLDFSHLMMENKVQGCTIMINKDLAAKIYELPTHVSMHDAWIGLIATTMGKLDYIDRPTMAYRQHAENAKGSVNYWRVILMQFQNLSAQKYIVYRQATQINEFLRIYGNELKAHDRKAAEAFSTLEQQNFFIRRINIIRYHLWKTGIVRNIGLLILI